MVLPEPEDSTKIVRFPNLILDIPFPKIEFHPIILQEDSEWNSNFKRGLYLSKHEGALFSLVSLSLSLEDWKVQFENLDRFLYGIECFLKNSPNEHKGDRFKSEDHSRILEYYTTLCDQLKVEPPERVAGLGRILKSIAGSAHRSFYSDRKSIENLICKKSELLEPSERIAIFLELQQSLGKVTKSTATSIKASMQEILKAQNQPENQTIEIILKSLVWLLSENDPKSGISTNEAERMLLHKRITEVGFCERTIARNLLKERRRERKE